MLFADTQIPATPSALVISPLFVQFLISLLFIDATIPAASYASVILPVLIQFSIWQFDAVCTKPAILESFAEKSPLFSQSVILLLFALIAKPATYASPKFTQSTLLIHFEMVHVSIVCIAATSLLEAFTFPSNVQFSIVE